jgi:hypothetical protein
VKKFDVNRLPIFPRIGADIFKWVKQSTDGGLNFDAGQQRDRFLPTATTADGILKATF